MPDPVTGTIAAVGSIGSSIIGSKAAGKAGRAQADASIEGTRLSVEEQRAAREEMRKLLQPYVDAGTPALRAQMDYLGFNGPQAQQAFAQQQEANPLFQSLVAQGEDAILQNAAATGGLRGGNTQGALAQFRPAMLKQFMEDQYSKLGAMTQLGQNSAAGVGNAGLNTASNIGNLFMQNAQTVGSARAGTALAQGQAMAAPFNMLSQFAGLQAAKGLF